MAARDAQGRFSFADALERKLYALIERVSKSLILEINRELRRSGTGTPVDTGHARANWIPSVGEPNAIEANDDGAAAQGTAAIASFKLGQGKLYITNVVPYIRRLNDGWSDKAPALFVEACISRAMQTMKERTGVDFGINSLHSEANESAANNMADAYSPFSSD